MAYFRCGMGGGASDNFDFIAPVFSESETYNADDLVLKDGILYKCLTDNTIGLWNASKWKVTTLAESSALNSNLKPKILSNVSRSSTGSNNLKSVFDISSLYIDYKNITIDNLIVKVKTFRVSGTSSFTWQFSYDQTSGLLTVDSGQTGLLCYPSVIDIYIVK